MSYRNPIRALGMTFLVLGAASVVAAAQKYMGTVLSASENQLVLMVGTESLTFKLQSDTSVTLNGKEAKIGDLKQDDAAEVHAERGEDDVFVASAIKATRDSGGSSQRPLIAGLSGESIP